MRCEVFQETNRLIYCGPTGKIVSVTRDAGEAVALDTPLLALRNAGKSYGELAALSGIDLELYAGGCVALVGHNGSGKTTALKLAAREIEPTKGSIEVGGTEVQGDSDQPTARRAVAVVRDEPVFYEDLTVGEHLQLVGLAHGVSEGLDGHIEDLLEQFNLKGREGFLPGQLSRGLRQKAQLACALVRPFSVLLLDEPVVGLDPDSQAALRETLLDLKARGKAVLLSTHQLGFARGLADWAMVLQDGKTVAAGSYEAILEQEALYPNLG